MLCYMKILKDNYVKNMVSSESVVVARDEDANSHI